MTDVVVIGAGYAGTLVANRLARRNENLRITVVNPRADFVERVRLHEHLAGTGSAAVPLTSMLRPGVELRVAEAERIDDGTVVLSDGDCLRFDHAFLAVGSTVTPLEGTVPIGVWEGMLHARSPLEEVPSGDSVTVVGGGLTGVETASEVAEARPDLRVQLIAESVAPSLSAGAQLRVRRILERLGVEIVAGVVSAAEPGRGGSVRLTSGDVLGSDLTLWCVISAVPDLAARSGLAVDSDGRALVDEYLRSVTDRRVFAVGDCAAVPGSRMSCATAAPQGAHAADVLTRLLRNREPKPYSMGYSGQALSLGRRNAIVQAGHRDDRPRRTYFSGPIAAAGKELVSRYAKYGSRTAVYAWLPGKK